RGEKADRKSSRALARGLFHHRQHGLGAVPRGQSEGRGGAAAPRLRRAARCRDRRAPRRGAVGDGPARRGRARLAGVAQVRAGKRHAAKDDQAPQAVMAMVMRRAAAYALAALVLGGCAQLETRPAQKAEFDLAGRLAARYGEESFTGNIAWRHAKDFDEMLITTPLGQGVARIAREGDQATLTTAEPREYHAADVESLTQQVLGFRLPLDGLADWVRGLRTDGYHELQTVFRLIDRCDRVGIAPRPDGKVRFEGPFGEENLCVRAARLLQRETSSRRGAELRLEKHLPVGGGLGGGSSDAATVLLVLNRLWEVNLGRARLREIGLQLGADVPFFIFGRNAVGEGIGERLRGLELPAAWYLVLTPQVSVSTKEMFASALTADTKRLKIPPFFSGQGRNDLEPVVTARYPEIAA